MFKQLRKTLSLILCFAMLLSLLPQIPILATAQEAEPLSEPESVLPANGALEGICGENLRWELRDDHILFFYGFGDMQDFNSPSEVPWAQYRDMITDAYFDYAITSIGDYAFWGCKNLSSISIPEMVEQIGDYAFYDCTGLLRIAFQGNPPMVGAHSFDYVNATMCHSCQNWNWTEEAKAAFGEKLLWIGHLYSVNYTEDPSCITNRIENGWCYDCYSSIRVLIPNTILGHDYSSGAVCARCGTNDGPVNGACGEEIFWELTDNQLLLISGSGVMENYSSPGDAPWSAYHDLIQTVAIQDGITNIGDYAFYGLNALSDIYIPSTITQIGDYAFYNCTGLHEIPFQGNPPTIGENSFGNVKGMAYHSCGNWEWTEEIKASFGENLKWFGHLPFGWDYQSSTCVQNMVRYGSCDRCWEWFEISIPGTRKNHDYSSSNYCYNCGLRKPLQYGHCGEELGWYLDEYGELVIDGSGPMWDFTENNPAPWYEKRDLITKIILQEEFTAVGDYAFCGLTSLKEITIPNSLSAIGDYAFYDCVNLHELTFGGNAPTVGENSFGNVKAVVYSSCQDLSWTEEAKAAFGENIQWAGHLVTCNGYEFPTCFEEERLFVRCDECCEEFYVSIPGTTTEHDFSGGNSCRNCSMGSPVQSGECGDDLVWSLDRYGILTIGGTGPMWDFDQQNPAPWYEYRNKIYDVRLRGPVTGIGNYAFYQCAQINNFIFSDELLSIGNYACYGCYCVYEFDIPDGVTFIGDYAFAGCSHIYDVRFSDKLEVLGDYALSGCISLHRIYFGYNAPVIGANAFDQVSAAAFHSCMNYQWTEEMEQLYGGDIAWVGHIFESGDSTWATCTENSVFFLDTARIATSMLKLKFQTRRWDIITTTTTFAINAVR